ncbi:hypothetical protein N7470_010267 [Penicillium chermesinum]|nr:hypothetical protein N7470_010267 [Penicillium chermesinum]
MEGNTLTWSAQLAVTPPKRAPRLPGDKIVLPQSALEQLLAAAPLQAVSTNPRVHTSSFDPFNPHTFAAESIARQQVEHRQQQLPHPLTFRIVNPENGRFVYAGIREFSAAENEVILSALLKESLGIQDTSFQPEDLAISDTDVVYSGQPSDSNPSVTVHAKQLPKGTYVRLRPLEAGYDPEDWKALLERHLRDNFTTLTVNELLTVPGTRNESFRFLVDKLYPEGDGICVVDTDLEVDIVALSEEQARETLQKRLERATRAPGTANGSSVGGTLTLGEEVASQVIPGEYVDYELREWIREDTVRLEIVSDDPSVCLFASPLSSRQQGRPRTDIHVWGQFPGPSTKRIIIQPTNMALEGAEALYISAHASPMSLESEPSAAPTQNLPVQYTCEYRKANQMKSWKPMILTSPAMFSAKIAANGYHSGHWFCTRTSVCAIISFAPNATTSSKKDPLKWQSHWHCPHDSSYGNDEPSKTVHDSMFHTPHACVDCGSQFEGLPALAHHRTTDCPKKLILCQFCHLLVPQQGDSDPDLLDPEVMLSGLTPHELVDGGRTTDCHLCGKIIRLRDMKTHLRHHDLERVSRPPPRICLNQNCGRTLSSASNKSLGLCSVCFGPLYVDTYDPEGKALRRRIERRYLSQMMSGCAKPWCQNRYCKNGKQKNNQAATPATGLSVADIMKITRPLVEPISVQPETPNTAPFYFCTDELGQIRRNIAEMIFADSAVSGKGYDFAWCVAGAEAAGGDLDKAREWLAKWAPTQEETANQEKL